MDEFINEQKLYEKSKYGNTYQQIQLAKKIKDIEMLRGEVKTIVFDSEKYKELDKADWKTLVKIANQYMKQRKAEIDHRRIIDKINKEIERLHKEDEIRIYAHASTPKELEIKFVGPIFTTQDDLKYTLEFLKNSESITVEASPKVVGKWDVHYSGDVTNNKGEKLEFEDINNGLAVVPN